MGSVFETKHWIYGPRSMTNCVFDEREKLVKIVKGGYFLSIDSQFFNPIVRSRRTNIEREHDAERIEISETLRARAKSVFIELDR